MSDASKAEELMSVFEKMQEMVEKSPTHDYTILKELLDRLRLTALYSDNYELYRAYALVITDDIHAGDCEEFLSAAQDYWEATEEERDRNLTPH